MKILYGVQATGNGHITRARVLGPALIDRGAEVDFLFSGRAKDQLFNMEPFGDFQCRQGLTFSMSKGRVELWKTLVGNDYRQLYRDIKRLDLSGYDLVVSDFEPVTAWAARKQGVESVGIAHQYAFLNPLPDRSIWRFLKPQMKLFAPVRDAVGLHWDSFGGHCLPPLIQPPMFTPTQVQGKYVVYLPHDDLAELQQALKSYAGQQFYIYCAVKERSEQGNLVFCPFSRNGFQQDLASCEGVICNAGFGLLSEAMQYGKKILCLPQAGQPEQISNARILAGLKRGVVVKSLRVSEVFDWFDHSAPAVTRWPDVGGALADWLVSDRKIALSSLGDELWSQVSERRENQAVSEFSHLAERS